jgi:hypothetical protein
MKTALSLITESDFNKENNLIIFQDKVANHRYAQLKHGNNSFRLAWHSDSITPVISEIRNNIFSIGIDQNFAIIDFENDKILLNLDFLSFFYYTELLDNFIYIITELEIIKVDTINFKVLETIGLPDIFREMTIMDDKILIQCFDDRIVEILR